MHRKLSHVPKISRQISQTFSSHQFLLHSSTHIPDFNLDHKLFIHSQTGTEYTHIANSDPNNLFSIQFQTLPNNDKGIPHILEHMALCGSKTYPVRDPFFKMIKRSLNTFMNAMTTPDFTCYPFSTQNPQDFQNLLNIYLDASLNPLLSHNDFLQEGWRIDFEKNQKNDQKENQQTDPKVIFKGVVYNEMKGVYQNPSSFYQDKLSNLLFPNNSVYSKMYGGNPTDIPSLTHEELLQFHKTYYHPSNAKILTYGNMDPENHMVVMEKYLKDFQKQAKGEQIQNQQRWTGMKEVILKAPVDDMAVSQDRQTKLSFNYLCNDIGSPYESLCMNILNNLLFDSPNGALYKALIESQVASSFSPGCGYQIYQKEGILSIGVDQISEDQETLIGLTKTGFPSEQIESTLHQVEIQNKKPKANFGLSLLYSQMANLNHGVSIPASLDLSNTIKQIRENVKKGLFEGLIKKYILDNQHCVKVQMNPDQQDNYQTHMQKLEEQQLKEIQKKLTKDDIERILKQNEELQKEQDDKDRNIELLPSLKVSDIQREEQKVNFEVRNIENTQCYFFPQDTNGLTFLRIKIDAHNFNNPEYTDIFCSIFNNLGTKHMKQDKFQEELKRYSTDFSVTFKSQQLLETGKTDEYYLVNIACLDKNVEKMFSLLQQLFSQPDFEDHLHIQNQLSQIGASISDQISDSPLNYAINFAQSGLIRSQREQNMIKSSRFINKVCKEVQEQNKQLNKGKEESSTEEEQEPGEESQFLPSQAQVELEEKLKMIQIQFLNKNRVKFSIHSEKKNFDKLELQVKNFLEVFQATEIPKNEKELFVEQYHRHYFEMPMQVNFVTESFKTPHFLDPDAPKVHIMSHLLQNIFLHKEIREKGGAYGSGCKFSSEGVITFFSYRDPNHLQTFSAFENSISYILSQPISDCELSEAKLSLFQSFDSLVAPQNKGLSLFLNQVGWEQRQKFREGVLDCTVQDVKQVCQKYLVKKQSSRVVFGSSEHQALFKDKDWQVEKPII